MLWILCNPVLWVDKRVQRVHHQNTDREQSRCRVVGAPFVSLLLFGLKPLHFLGFGRPLPKYDRNAWSLLVQIDGHVAQKYRHPFSELRLSTYYLVSGQYANHRFRPNQFPSPSLPRLPGVLVYHAPKANDKYYPNKPVVFSWISYRKFGLILLPSEYRLLAIGYLRFLDYRKCSGSSIYRQGLRRRKCFAPYRRFR